MIKLNEVLLETVEVMVKENVGMLFNQHYEKLTDLILKRIEDAGEEPITKEMLYEDWNSLENNVEVLMAEKQVIKSSEPCQHVYKTDATKKCDKKVYEKSKTGKFCVSHYKDDEIDDSTPKCQHLLKNGNRQNQECGKPAKENHDYCRTHLSAHENDKPKKKLSKFEEIKAKEKATRAKAAKSDSDDEKPKISGKIGATTKRIKEAEKEIAAKEEDEEDNEEEEEVDAETIDVEPFEGLVYDLMSTGYSSIPKSIQNKEISERSFTLTVPLANPAWSAEVKEIKFKSKTHTVLSIMKDIQTWYKTKASASQIKLVNADLAKQEECPVEDVKYLSDLKDRVKKGDVTMRDLLGKHTQFEKIEYSETNGWILVLSEKEEEEAEEEE